MGGIHFGNTHSHDLDAQATQGAAPWRRSGWHGCKLVTALLAVSTTILMPLRFYLWHVLLLIFLCLVVLLAKVPVKPLLKRLLQFSPFIACTAIASLWHGAGGPGWETVAVRGSLSLLVMLVFASLTPFSILPGLLKRAGMPELLATTMMLMHRYLFVLSDERERMRKASASRRLKPSAERDWGLPAALVGRLFIRASSRAERVYHAMCARGWR